MSAHIEACLAADELVELTRLNRGPETAASAGVGVVGETTPTPEPAPVGVEGFAELDSRFESLRLGVEYMLGEAERGFGGRMMTVGLHSRWSGQASRAQAVRDFAEYVTGRDGVCFMRRVDIAQYWLETYGDLPVMG